MSTAQTTLKMGTAALAPAEQVDAPVSPSDLARTQASELRGSEISQLRRFFELLDELDRRKRNEKETQAHERDKSLGVAGGI